MLGPTPDAKSKPCFERSRFKPLILTSHLTSHLIEVDEVPPLLEGEFSTIIKYDDFHLAASRNPYVTSTVNTSNSHNTTNYILRHHIPPLHLNI